MGIFVSTLALYVPLGSFLAEPIVHAFTPIPRVLPRIDLLIYSIGIFGVQ